MPYSAKYEKKGFWHIVKEQITGHYVQYLLGIFLGVSASHSTNFADAISDLSALSKSASAIDKSVKGLDKSASSIENSLDNFKRIQHELTLQIEGFKEHSLKNELRFVELKADISKNQALNQASIAHMQDEYLRDTRNNTQALITQAQDNTQALADIDTWLEQATKYAQLVTLSNLKLVQASNGKKLAMTEAELAQQAFEVCEIQSQALSTEIDCCKIGMAYLENSPTGNTSKVSFAGGQCDKIVPAVINTQATVARQNFNK